MKCWVARRTSRPRGVAPEAAAPAITTSSAIMTKVTMWPRLGPLTRATEKLPRGRVPPRLDDTIFLLEARLDRRPLPGSFLCGSSRPPMPGGSLPVPRRSRRYRPALRIRSETSYKASQCGIYPGQTLVCGTAAKAGRLPRHVYRSGVSGQPGWPYVPRVRPPECATDWHGEGGQIV